MKITKQILSEYNSVWKVEIIGKNNIMRQQLTLIVSFWPFVLIIFNNLHSHWQYDRNELKMTDFTSNNSWCFPSRPNIFGACLDVRTVENKLKLCKTTKKDPKIAATYFVFVATEYCDRYKELKESKANKTNDKEWDK